MPWPKGRPFSVEHKAHLSASAPKTHSARHIASLSGKGNGRYKHGKGADPRSRKPFLDARQKAITRDKSCHLCGAMKDLCAHHINGNEFCQRLDNLMTLCRSCHTLVHGFAKRWKGPEAWRRARWLVQELQHLSEDTGKRVTGGFVS
jgi:5-methylcytosine-specific restriction endonuclease McrA